MLPLHLITVIDIIHIVQSSMDATLHFFQYGVPQEKINISACVNGIPYINGAREMGVYERIASVT